MSWSFNKEKRPIGSEVANLEVIVAAIRLHNESCDFPAIAIRMNPYEVERLAWDEIMGLPIESDPKIGTGRFVIVCAGRHEGEGVQVTDAVSRERELQAA